MRIGIIGGTFNPVHHGHLLLAESAREALALERVLFIPANQPPHKPGARLLSGKARLAMLKLAIRDHAGFAASEIELSRPGPSYTLETLQTIRRSMPDAKLFLIIGQDLLRVRWKAWSQIKRLCTVVVAKRPGSRVARKEKGVVWLEMPQVAVSASEIRMRVRAGRSIRYLVPRSVERYIRSHHLYRRNG